MKGRTWLFRNANSDSGLALHERGASAANPMLKASLAKKRVSSQQNLWHLMVSGRKKSKIKTRQGLRGVHGRLWQENKWDNCLKIRLEIRASLQTPRTISEWRRVCSGLVSAVSVIAGVAPAVTRNPFHFRVLHLHPTFSERSGSAKSEVEPDEGLTILVPFFSCIPV